MIMGTFGFILQGIALTVIIESFFITELKTILIPISLTISIIGWIILIFFFDHQKPLLKVEQHK